VGSITSYINQGAVSPTGSFRIFSPVSITAPLTSPKMSDEIYIQHICGYNYSKEGYQHKAKLLQEAGFHCLREVTFLGDTVSLCEKYYEVWYLPFIHDGPLKGMTHKQAVDWVISNINPGQIWCEGKMWGLSAG
jgi:hypothetical protein